MSADTLAKTLGPTAQPNKTNEKKNLFKYEDYVARKLRIQSSLEKRIKKWQLPENYAKFELNKKPMKYNI
jgi:hypothetical protein